MPEQFHFRLGQTVVAIGAPEGLDHTVTKGIISAVGRQPEVDRPMVYVQTDAPINPGNSGGPLIDRNGNLVGINTFIVTSGGGSEGLGFAIPEPIVRFVYHELKEHGIVPQVTIGAHAQSITPALAAGLKLPQDWGVILSDIDPGGPAAAAGLQAKDVVTTMDGFRVDALPKYTAFLYVHKRGTPITDGSVARRQADDGLGHARQCAAGDRQSFGPDQSQEGSDRPSGNFRHRSQALLGGGHAQSPLR